MKSLSSTLRNLKVLFLIFTLKFIFLLHILCCSFSCLHFEAISNVEFFLFFIFQEYFCHFCLHFIEHHIGEKIFQESKREGASRQIQISNVACSMLLRNPISNPISFNIESLKAVSVNFILREMGSYINTTALK